MQHPLADINPFMTPAPGNPGTPGTPGNPGNPGTGSNFPGMSPAHYPAGHSDLSPYNMSPGGAGMQRYREMTIDELLLEKRILFLVGEINYSSATSLIMRMLYLANQNDNEIHLYINSPGGAVDDTLAIYDTMRYLPCEISTYCIGRAMSGGAIVLASGTKDKRYALPHAKVMIHQPYGGVGGQTSDVKIMAEEIIKSKNILNQLLADHTGQSPEQVKEDSERDKFFNAQEAKDYGLIDTILESHSDKKEPKTDKA